MYKGIKIFLEKLKFFQNYQRFLSKIGRIFACIEYCVMRIAWILVLPAASMRLI
jgi:IS4 transposase